MSQSESPDLDIEKVGDSIVLTQCHGSPADPVATMMVDLEEAVQVGRALLLVPASESSVKIPFTSGALIIIPSAGAFTLGRALLNVALLGRDALDSPPRPERP